MSISSRPELNIDLRHDFILILSEDLTEDQTHAMLEDLESLEFNCAMRREQESKQWQLLIGLNDHERILREAESQFVMVPRLYLDEVKQSAKDKRK